MERVVCIFGLVVFMALAWSVSTNRRRIPWRTVGGGLLLQFVLAFLVLMTAPGQWLFQTLGAGFNRVMECVGDGSSMLFTVFPDDSGKVDLVDSQALIRTFAFGVLPTVIFFSSLMSILYYCRIVQPIVQGLAWVMRRTLGTTGAETLAAAANVFVGHTEAPLVVRPYLPTMNRSELNAMMVGGFATVTGGLWAAYGKLGIEVSHLMTASVISAPAALLIAKIMVPDEDSDSSNDADAAERSADNQETEFAPPSAATESQAPSSDADSQAPVNMIDAAVVGASDGLKLALNIGAVLIAFLALIAVVDLTLASLCSFTHMETVVDGEPKPWLSLTIILGWLGYPIALLLGIPPSECSEAGSLIGLKTVANEFVAYDALGASRTLSDRTVVVLTYALAGFSNFGAIGIQVGGIGAMVPERRKELAKLGLRAMFGGFLACCMTAAVAGIFYFPSLSDAKSDSTAELTGVAVESD
ncbi:MAG: nucleoside transporter C-terminal domain-containing protein, partial [Planctomycetota bacterium]